MRVLRLTAVAVAVGSVVSLAAPAASAAPAEPAGVDQAAIAPYTVGPGRFGPLTMGVSTRAYAMQIGYLKRTRDVGFREVPYCWADGWRYYTHVGDYADFRQVADGVRRSSDRVSLWVSSPRAVTSKGLRTTDSMSRLRALYPGAARTTGMTEWGRRYSIYSVRGANGYLDIYRFWTPDSSVARDNFFVVRTLTARQYHLPFDDGPGPYCDGRDY